MAVRVTCYELDGQPIPVALVEYDDKFVRIVEFTTQEYFEEWLVMMLELWIVNNEITITTSGI
jgi:hypothetical protein